MVDFNETKNNYKSQIEKVIAFSGQGLDFFTQIKAECLRCIFEFHGLHQLKILDVGSGHGYIHKYLLDFGCEINGIEVAKEVLPLAKKLNPRADYSYFDGHSIPFKKSNFDVVIAISVMHHVKPDNWQNLVNEMRRVLKPGGIIVIFEHNPWNPITRYIVANNSIDEDAILLKPNITQKLLRKSGFLNIKTRYIIFTPFSGSFFRFLDNILRRLPLGAQYYTIGKVH